MAQLEDVARWIVSRDDFAVVAHVSPDGDSVGSGLALVMALEKAGKRAALVSRDEIPAMYRFLPRVGEAVAPDKLPFAPQCVLYEDVAAFDRAGDGGALSLTVKDSALLDHHGTNPGFADLNVILPNAAATGEIVMRLIDVMGVELDGDMALCLYTAVSTDTGNFSFSNTNRDTLYTFSRCLAAGFDLAGASRRLFRMRSASRTRLLGWALDRIELYADGAIAMVRLPAEAFTATGAARAETEGIVSFLIDIEGVRFAILAESRQENQTKFSLRADERHDAAAVARALGGGGHLRAAGVTVNLPLEEAARLILDAVAAQFKDGSR